jgi:hypothetical protein
MTQTTRLATTTTSARSWRTVRRGLLLAALALASAACSSGGTGPAPDDLRIESFEVSLDRLPAGGGEVTLAWRVSGADSLRIDNRVGEVTGLSTTATVKRNTRFTLTATRAERSVSASATVLVDAAPLTYSIDPGLPLATTLTRPDGSLVPLAASQDAAGVTSTFVADEVIVASGDRADAVALAARYGGTVVGDDAVPAPPPGLGVELTPAERRASYHVVRVDPSTVSLEDFPANALRAGLGGDFKFSSTGGARLQALATAEQAAGRAVTLNYVVHPDAVLNATAECTNRAAGCVDDGFFEPRFLETGSRANVVGAWQFIAGRSMQRRVRVAIIDGGFWIDGGTGRPKTIPGVGHDYPAILGQYDFDADAPRVGGTNPGKCTGGSDCPWHGNGSASVALGVVDNGQAAAGTGGQVSDAFLLHMDGTYFQIARAIRTATAWRADLVSMSFGYECNSACDVGKYLVGDPLGFAVEQARRGGLVMVAAAGNTPIDVTAADVEPCTLDGVICVGALVDGTTSATSYSGWAGGVDLWAPTNLLAVYAGAGVPTGLTSFGGTSASTPFVTGIAAMMKAVNPGLDGDRIRDLLRATAGTDSADFKVSHYVNALAAVRAAAADQLFPDSLEVPGVAFPAGRVDDLSIHSAADRDEYRFSVSGPSRLGMNYDFASRLGVLRTRLVQIKGCGAPLGERKGTGPGAYFYQDVDYLPPGDYALRLGASAIGAPGEPDLTAYWLDWKTEPVASLPTDPDDFEPNDSFPTASLFPGGSTGKATLHRAGDLDHYRVRGEASIQRGPLTLDSYFSIPSTSVPLRLTLLTTRGEATGISAESDANCSEPLGLHLPEGDYVVEVEGVSGTTGNYEVGAGRGIAGVYLPHAPLRWEARKGLAFESVLSDDAIDHIYIPDGTASYAQVLGQGVDIALYDAAGQLLQAGQSLPGLDGTVVLLGQLAMDQVYFIELSYQGAVGEPGTPGKLPGLPYRLSVE